MRLDSVTRLLCLLMLTQRTASYMPGLVGRRGAVPLRRASKIAAKAAAAPPKYITEDVGNNVTPYIENLVGRGLHRAEAHPLGIIKAKIEAYFNTLEVLWAQSESQCATQRRFARGTSQQARAGVRWRCVWFSIGVRSLAVT